MFSDRWKLLKEMIDECLFTTPDRYLTHSQCIQLFHAFLLQVKENEGMVYIVQSEKSGHLSTYFASSLTNSLNVSARELFPIHKDVTLHLALLLKKTDLVITLGHSTDTLGAAAIAKGNDVPLITLSGGLKENTLKDSGDLNICFDESDQALIQTGKFSFFNMIVDAWSYELEPLFPQKELFLPQAKPQNLLTGLRI